MSLLLGVDPRLNRRPLYIQVQTQNPSYREWSFRGADDHHRAHRKLSRVSRRGYRGRVESLDGRAGKAIWLEVIPENVVEVKLEGDKKIVKTEEGSYFSQALIICTGTEYRKLGVPVKRSLQGRGSPIVRRVTEPSLEITRLWWWGEAIPL